MVDILLLQTVSIAIASVGVFAAAIYYVLQLKHQNRMRQTDLLVRISPWLSMSSSELQQACVRVLNLEYTDYDDFVKKFGQLHSEKPEQTAILAVANYFEAIGILAKRKLVDIDLVFDFWRGDIPEIWEKIKPVIEGTRKKSSQSILVNTEYLYNEMKKREQRQ